MYLKSIEIQGFKSFANKTLFEFHNGITCIVGPNGSGKSNVADAVRWVLGEQSSKQLRGTNMQDVIFSGTENRRPQSFASVSITFDNSDRQLNLDYNEVTVARRIYRSGESEYLLNKTQCRLKDVAELFYDTGIGKEGYSIIGQGQIDKILSTKPEDRRELFDEAAGIVKFKRRKAAALKRLENEQANMVRISDIMAELGKQTGPLERQARTAREYLRLRDELKEYDVSAYVLESGRLEAELSGIEGKLSAANSDHEDAAKENKALKAKYEKQQTELSETEGELEKLRGGIMASQARRQEKESEINVLKEQINTGHLSRQHTIERLEVIDRESAEYESQLKAHEQSRQECSRKLYDVQTSQGRMRAELAAVQESLAGLQKMLKDEQSRMMGLLNEKSSYVGELQKYETLLEQAKTEQAQMNRRLLESKTEESIWQKRLLEGEAAYKKASEEQAALLKKQEKDSTGLEAGRKKRGGLQEEYYEQRRLHQVTVTREESLRNLAERYEGYGSSIRKIMEVRGKNPGIHGVVADLIHVDKKYETAIETALGGAIQNIVTDNEQTAKHLIAWLKQGRYGRATFLPLDAITVRDEFSQKDALKEPGVIGLASTLVKTDAVYRRLAVFLLGRIIVVDNIDNGIRLSAKYKRSLRIVTLEGELLNPGGSMTGGAFRNTSNLLGRNRELEELQKKIKEETGTLDRLSRNLEEAAAGVSKLEEQVKAQEKQIQSCTLKETEGRLKMQEARQRVEEIIKSREHLGNELILQGNKMREITASCEKARNSIKKLESEGDKSQDSVQRSQSSAQKAQEESNGLSESLSRLDLEYSKLQQQEQFIAQNIVRVQEELRKRQEEKAALEDAKKAGEQAVSEKEAMIEKAKAVIADIEETERKQQQKLAELNEKKARMNDLLGGFFAKNEELSQRITMLDRELLRLENQKERHESRLDEIASYIWDEYEIRPSEARAAFKGDAPGLPELKKHIGELKKSIRALGSVNVNSIEEYKEVSERYTFMKTQYNDLTESEKSLQKVIAELDAGMRRQFTEKFAQIKEEFDKVFGELFGGGKGTLELVEGEDVIEAGVRIISQPPGKKLQNMMQLSGGEKALTAIALLFAIQNLKPSPFCLLDEIEAALDDSNVGRFSGYLHKLAKNTQFIVITHRRGTMTSADRLYGITMQEKGVSALVSVNLIESQLDK